MKIGVFINTPSQLHFYRNIIKNLERDGNSVFIVARNYGETFSLLKELDIPYYSYSNPPVSKQGKILALPADVARAYRYLRAKNVDLVTGFGIYNTLTSALLNKPDIIFNDTETLSTAMSYTLQVKLFTYLTDAIVTPAFFRESMGTKQIKIKSFKEMAYLHPDYFTPNDEIFNTLGVRKREDYVLVRFNAFDALHDVGINGFSDDDKVTLVKGLEKYAHVFITSEVGVPAEIKGNILETPKKAIHDIMYYAKMLVTDTSTIAAEAAILGTPAIRTNRFVGKNDFANYIELEKEYGLMFNYSDTRIAIQKAIELVQQPDLKVKWQELRKVFLKNNIDTTRFMTWFLENYPDSMSEVRKNPDAQFTLEHSKTAIGIKTL